MVSVLAPVSVLEYLHIKIVWYVFFLQLNIVKIYIENYSNLLECGAMHLFFIISFFIQG